MSTGSFLKEKMGNMALWLQMELKDRSSVHFKIGLEELSKRLGTLSSFQATSLALKLLDVQQAITDRDFDALFCAPDTPPDIAQLISEIQPHTDMHDKFWRYLSLFVSTVSD